MAKVALLPFAIGAAGSLSGGAIRQRLAPVQPETLASVAPLQYRLSGEESAGIETTGTTRFSTSLFEDRRQRGDGAPRPQS
jgi:hypothetical protein